MLLYVRPIQAGMRQTPVCKEITLVLRTLYDASVRIFFCFYLKTAAIKMQNALLEQGFPLCLSMSTFVQILFYILLTPILQILGIDSSDSSESSEYVKIEITVE